MGNIMAKILSHVVENVACVSMSSADEETLCQGI